MLRRVTVSILYQKVVSELEAVLSPRVVSRSLNAALKHHAKTPENATYEDFAKVLQEDISKQLQHNLSPELAKGTIEKLLWELQELEQEEHLSSVLGPQEKAFNDIHARLKAYSLYFDWPETQKLKAQLQLIEQELQARHDSSELLLKAREQIEQVEQKHADLLLYQGEELTRLEEAYEQLSKLEHPKLKRFHRLIEHIRQAQASKQIVIAEQERAFKLLAELKGVAIEEGLATEVKGQNLEVEPLTKTQARPLIKPRAKPLDESFDGLLLEVSDEEDKSHQLLMLQLADEKRSLEQLFQKFQNLLDYRNDIITQLKQAQKQLYLNQPLGPELGRLQSLCEEAYAEMQESLKVELQGIENSMQTMHQALDTRLLGQALFVTQHMLGNVLPAKADVKEIRDRHKLLMKQTYALGEMQQRARRGIESKLEQQAEALEEFKATFQSYSRYVETEPRRSFSDLIQLLEASQQKRELVPESIAEGHRLAAVFEASALMQSHDERLTQRSHLSNLILQLRHLPRLEESRKRFDEVTQHLQKILAKLDDETLSQEEFERCDLLVSRLKNDIAIFYRQQLDRFAERARYVSDHQLLAMIQEARAALAEGDYPDSSEIEKRLEISVDKRLGEELAELHQLEAERRRLGPKQPELLAEFDALLMEIRSELERGQLAGSLEQAWSLLNRLRDEQDAWSRSFLPRLDKLRAAFPQVGRLNTSSSYKLSRLLNHLDEQRSQLSKLSATSQERFELALQRAEQRLHSLEADYHLTRVVAGRLASGHVLDQLLGFSEALSPQRAADPLADFDEDTFISLDAPLDHGPVVVRSANAMLNEWLDDYLEDSGVRDMMVFDGEGEILAGYSHQDSYKLYDSFMPLKDAWQSLGQELHLGRYRLFTLESAALVLIVVWLKHNHSTLLILDNPNSLNPVMNKLRRDLPAIGRILSESSFA
ncbi:MAG: hypothetical protein R2880_10365 [Deinococcales bacterium]